MKKGPLKITDFVEPQRTGPSLDTRRAVALHIVTLQRKAADPATPAETAAKSRRLVSNYRARTAKRPAGLRRANAKNMEKLFARVVAHIRCGLREGVLRESANPIVTREAIARYLAVPEHQVEQVFKRLV